MILALSIATPAFLWSAGSPAGGWWQIWPWLDHANAEAPQGFALVLAGLVGLAESAALGLAVAFAVYGLPAVRRLAASRPLCVAVHASAVWMLGNWWIHDNLHYVNGLNMDGLLVIVYAFHFTLIVAGAIICYALSTGFHIAVARPETVPLEPGSNAAMPGRDAT